MNISTSNVRTVGLTEAQAEPFAFSGRILKEAERLTWIKQGIMLSFRKNWNLCKLSGSIKNRIYQ